MTSKKDKSQDKITKAGAVELEENELDNVTGGAAYLKIGDIKGESNLLGDKAGLTGYKLGTTDLKIDSAKSLTGHKFSKG